MGNVVIKIGNSHSQIECNHVIYKLVSDELSYEMPGANFALKYRRGWDGRIRLMKKGGVFPTGLLRRVCRFLKKEEIPWELKDLRSTPKELFNFEIEEKWKPRPYQIEATNVALQRGRGVFIIGTGGGKTLCVALLIAQKKVPTLVVAPDTGIREQTIREFRGMFKKGDALVSSDINSQAPIVVANIQNLVRRKESVFKRFRMLITDEFHHSSAKSYLSLNKMASEAFYRYGFTGTFFRSDGTDMTMHGVLSEAIYRKTTSELIEEGWLVRPDIKIIQYQTSGLSRHNYRQAYDAIIQDTVLNTIISRVAIEKIEEKKQTLILVRRKDHGEILSGLIGNCVYLHGSLPVDYRENMKDKFINREIQCLIATEIFGEGKDIPTIDVLINARYQKTEIQTAQGIGRALRKAEFKNKAEVFDFLIMGQRNLKEHSLARITTYKKEPAFKIKLINNVDLIY